MAIRSALFLAALCALALQSGTVCVHPPAGATRRVSLDEVRKAQADVKAKLAWAVEKAGRLPVDGPYDSGLPACRGRRTRTVRAQLPREFVGKTIAFAPSERLAEADFRVATSARKLSEIRADALADPALAERLGVRCAPSLVTVVSEVELELVENP